METLYPVTCFVQRSGGRWEASSNHNDNGQCYVVRGVGHSVPEALQSWKRKTGYRVGQYRVVEDRS